MKNLGELRKWLREQLANWENSIARDDKVVKHQIKLLRGWCETLDRIPPHVVDQWVLERTFNKHVTQHGDTIYWSPVIGGGEGYIVLFHDGSSLHTYHNPENL